MESIVGYVNSVTGSEISCQIQQGLIMDYCKEHDVQVRLYREDLTTFSVYTYKRKVTADWKQLYDDIASGKVKTILVDTVLRLHIGARLTQSFFKLCRDKNVEIIEVKPLKPVDQGLCKKVAIYHFTDGSTKRPGIAEKALDKLYSFSSNYDGWEIKGVFLDYTLKKTEQERHKLLMENIMNYNVLLTMDFYHIEIRTVTFWNRVVTLLEQGIQIESIKDGNLSFYYEKAWLQKPLRVAIYYRKSEAIKATDDVRVEVLNAFVSMRTKWTVNDTYIDRMRLYSDKQSELMSLLEHKDDYDLMLVNTFGDIHIRTAVFMKIKHKFNKPIYSLKEGGILL